jgi:hypothetical protein
MLTVEAEGMRVRSRSDSPVGAVLTRWVQVGTARSLGLPRGACLPGPTRAGETTPRLLWDRVPGGDDPTAGEDTQCRKE